MVDWPGSYHWRELMDVYPDAKVLLSVRSPESWVKSMHNTIAAIWFGDGLMHHLAQAQYRIDPLYAAWLDLLKEMWTKADIMVGSSGDPKEMAADIERWNQEVIDAVPSDRLLVWDPKDGWEPMCDLVGVDVPDTPLPNINDTENFQKNRSCARPSRRSMPGGRRTGDSRTRPHSARRPRRNRPSRDRNPRGRATSIRGLGRC